MLWKVVVLASLVWAVVAQNKSTSRSACALTESNRQECGFEGIPPNECLTRGCCWRPCEDCDKQVPWCFLSAGMLASRCQVESDYKQPCGDWGTKQPDCLMQGCCWRPSNQQTEPWCFYATAYTVEVYSTTYGQSDWPVPESVAKVNGQYVSDPNLPVVFRGINIVALDARTGHFINGRNFDLYLGYEAEMVAFIADEIPVNTVVLVSVWDEASEYCGSACETAIASLGGDITNLGYRDMFALVGYKSADGVMPGFVQQVMAGADDPGPISVVATIE